MSEKLIQQILDSLLEDNPAAIGEAELGPEAIPLIVRGQQIQQGIGQIIEGPPREGQPHYYESKAQREHPFDHKAIMEGRRRDREMIQMNNMNNMTPDEKKAIGNVIRNIRMTPSQRVENPEPNRNYDPYGRPLTESDMARAPEPETKVDTKVEIQQPELETKTYIPQERTESKPLISSAAGIIPPAIALAVLGGAIGAAAQPFMENKYPTDIAPQNPGQNPDKPIGSDGISIPDINLDGDEGKSVSGSLIKKQEDEKPVDSRKPRYFRPKLLLADPSITAKQTDIEPGDFMNTDGHIDGLAFFRDIYQVVPSTAGFTEEDDQESGSDNRFYHKDFVAPPKISKRVIKNKTKFEQDIFGIQRPNISPFMFDLDLDRMRSYLD